jgi:Dolichyl-phosphate-mannose-protein mannosyltransferase
VRAAVDCFGGGKESAGAMNRTASALGSRAGAPPRKPAALAWPLLLTLAGAKLLLHFAAGGHYGYFRDELYYIACGNHLAWGYVDQPPLVAVLARLSRWLLGDSLFAIRVFPALAGAGEIFLTGWIARELGGESRAQFLAAVAALLAPAFLAFDSFYSMNAFEPVFWMLCVALLVRIAKGADPRLWIVVGAIGGLGILNKYPILAFGFCLVVALLVTRARFVLRSRWVWIAALLALAIALPNLLWQWQHHWPQIETVRNAQLLKNVPVGAAQFMLELVLFLHPIALPVWFAGLGWLLFSRRGRRFQFLGWSFLFCAAVVFFLHGKSYYILPAFPILLASGGVALTEWFDVHRRWMIPVYASVLIVAGLITLPFGVPILPVNIFLRYQSVLPYTQPVKMEKDATGPLPQLYADMMGWDEMVKTVARVFHGLPPAEQPKCAILAGNYGEAGAVDLFGGKLGLPKAISGHNNYYLWGPRDYTGEVVISLGVEYQTLQELFGEITPAATISNPLGMPVESNLPVYICRRPKAPLRRMWPRLKYYI